MKGHLLFVDTETSGLPPRMDTATENVEAWPYIVQIAWVVYRWNGELIKSENYYIYDKSMTIESSAEKIHGISMEDLSYRGLRRKVVLIKLIKDLKKYEPLIVGHFIAFDMKMIEVALNRSGLKFPIGKLLRFCTMSATTEYTRLPNNSHPKLDDLYLSLFGKRMSQVHNAEADARATADCFFKLLEKGEITPESIQRQAKENKKFDRKDSKSGCGLSVVFFLVIIVLWIL